MTLYQDPEVRRYYPEGTLSLEETREELEWHQHGHPNHPEMGLWATVRKDTGHFIGRCGLLPWHIDDVDEVEIAYLIDEAGDVGVCLALTELEATIAIANRAGTITRRIVISP